VYGLHPRFNVSGQELINNHIHDLIVRLSVKCQINVDCFEPVLSLHMFSRHLPGIWRFWPQCCEVLAAISHLDTALKRLR
jgi:hypothetical protein